MKLSDQLPRGVTVGRRFYRMDFDYRRVLMMLETMARGDLISEARDYLALRCVMKRPPRRAASCAAALDAVRALLFPDAGKKHDEKRLTSFEQDADLIRAAFWQCYGVNLWRDKLHWLEFVALLSGLPDGSRYTEILGIRARPIPSANKYNQAEREWLIRAKAQCALEMSEEEQAQNYEKCVQNVFAGLLAMAQKEVKNNA